MKRKVIVNGSNFSVTTEVEDEICGDFYMEAATRALEIVFGNDMDPAANAGIVIPNPDEEPNLGLIIQTYLAEDEKNEEKHYYVRSMTAAQNAGLIWICEQLKKVEDNLKPGTDL